MTPILRSLILISAFFSALPLWCAQTITNTAQPVPNILAVPNISEKEATLTDASSHNKQNAAPPAQPSSSTPAQPSNQPKTTSADPLNKSSVPLAEGGVTNWKEWSLNTKEYIVSADHVEASKAGARLLEEGGNAIDAAVATNLALGVVRAHSAGIGGGGFMLYAPVGQEPIIIDWRETAPHNTSSAQYLDANGNVIPGKTVTGPWAVGVPGNLKGLDHVLKKYGTKTLAQVMAPAIDLAEKGFLVDDNIYTAMQTLQGRLNKEKNPALYAEAAHLYLKDGTTPYALNDTIKLPLLAQTLRLIAKEGIDVFYTGKLADAIIEALAGSPMTKEDLAAYTPQERKPLQGNFNGYTIYTMPTPSSGGASLLEILNIISICGGTERNATYYTVLAEAMKNAFADRANYLGDADFYPEVKTDIKGMISIPYAQLVCKNILGRAAKTIAGNAYGMGQFKEIQPDHGTTHLSVIDKQGNMVSSTDTVNGIYGSLISPKGYGFILNNQMDDFSVKGGVPNNFGLVMSDRNLIQANKRPLSSMTPTVAIKNGEKIAIGASGGPTIITGTLESLLNIILFGDLPREAVAAPRIHHQWLPDTLKYEKDFPQSVLNTLTQKGHTLEFTAAPIGTVQIALSRNGTLYGASDPRKGGLPAGK